MLVFTGKTVRNRNVEQVSCRNSNLALVFTGNENDGGW
jgi:hypothetical protein